MLKLHVCADVLIAFLPLLIWLQIKQDASLSMKADRSSFYLPHLQPWYSVPTQCHDNSPSQTLHSRYHATIPEAVYSIGIRSTLFSNLAIGCNTFTCGALLPFPAGNNELNTYPCFEYSTSTGTE